MNEEEKESADVLRFKKSKNGLIKKIGVTRPMKIIPQICS